MVLVDEAMARLARDRPEMSRESMAYVRGLLTDVITGADLAEGLARCDLRHFADYDEREQKIAIEAWRDNLKWAVQYPHGSE